MGVGMPLGQLDQLAKKQPHTIRSKSMKVPAACSEKLRKVGNLHKASFGQLVAFISSRSERLPVVRHSVRQPVAAATASPCSMVAFHAAWL